jgi:hypothetical protein
LVGKNQQRYSTCEVERARCKMPRASEVVV